MRNPDTPTNCSLVYKNHRTLRVVYNEFGNNVTKPGHANQLLAGVQGSPHTERNPDTPTNCSLVYKDHRTLRVRCAKGFDGGLPQQFVAEVRDSVGYLVRNITARGQAEFNVTELEPGVSYNVTVYSSNGKGRSPDTVQILATTEKYEHTTLYQRVS
ncbi:hypothetical protein J6590_077426, partial [Homalodisca vitripennis]